MKKISASLALFTAAWAFAGQAAAALYEVEFTGAVVGAQGTQQFPTGQAASYRFTYEAAEHEWLTPGDSWIHRDAISAFSGNVGDYTFEGRSGTVQMSDNATMYLNGDPVVFDELTMYHFRQDMTWLPNGAPREDFVRTDGPVGGHSLHMVSLVFGQSDVSLTDSVALTANTFTNLSRFLPGGAFLTLGFHNELFGMTPVTVHVSINAIQVSAVPEPEQLALLLAGLGVLGAVARRRRTLVN